jgi:hypothetical protein
LSRENGRAPSFQATLGRVLGEALANLNKQKESVQRLINLFGTGRAVQTLGVYKEVKAGRCF